MTVINILVVLFCILVAVAAFNWVIRQFPEFFASVAIYVKIINVIAVVATVIWLIGVLLGGWGSIGNIRIGR